MKNRVIATQYFITRFKKFKKKFPSLEEEIIELENILLENPHHGINLGANLYKVRLASKSKGFGKSGSSRIITYLINESRFNYEINLLTIYDKSDESTLTKEALLKLVKIIFT